MIKVTSRAALVYLAPKIPAWRYHRGCRSLAVNLGGVAAQFHVPPQQGENDNEYDVPEAIDAIAGSFLDALGDRDTIVRWAAAKALARLAERLPKEYVLS